MIKFFFRYVILIIIYISTFESDCQNIDYTHYHQNVIQIENLIAQERFSEALTQYDILFEDYAFVFVRDYKIATQLALLLTEHDKAYTLLKKGISAGWELKHIKKNKLINRLKSDSLWKQLKKEYKTLHNNYNKQFDSQLKKTIKKMFSKDQWKAIQAALKFNEKGQKRYLEKKFTPHSEAQIKELIRIFNSEGYPGEQLIGNNYWSSTIISHHNSITQSYTKQDTLYTTIKPLLFEALKSGNISPFELASIDEWYLMTKHNDGNSFYGILETPKSNQLKNINKRRETMGLRSIETRDKLIQLQNLFGIDFYLDGDPWY